MAPPQLVGGHDGTSAAPVLGHKPRDNSISAAPGGDAGGSRTTSPAPQERPRPQGQPRHRVPQGPGCRRWGDRGGLSPIGSRARPRGPSLVPGGPSPSRGPRSPRPRVTWRCGGLSRGGRGRRGPPPCWSGDGGHMRPPCRHVPGGRGGGNTGHTHTHPPLPPPSPGTPGGGSPTRDAGPGLPPAAAGAGVAQGRGAVPIDGQAAGHDAAAPPADVKGAPGCQLESGEPS